MDFLVILVCLAINYLWLKDFDRFDDTWFLSFRNTIERLSEKISSKLVGGWILSFSLIYAIPLIILSVLLFLLLEVVFGLPTMIVHIVILLVAFDRTEPGKLAKDFLSKWGEGNIEGSSIYLEREYLASPEQRLTNEMNMSNVFCMQLVRRCFEKVFVMLFWYILSGPLGVLLCYISYQLRDSRQEEQPRGELALINRVIWILELIPLRLLTITFSLVGNFEHCFKPVKESFWNFSSGSNSAELLITCANCALVGTSFADESVSDEAPGAERGNKQRIKDALVIEALQALLERSLTIWLALLALITIFAL